MFYFLINKLKLSHGKVKKPQDVNHSCSYDGK